MFSGCQNAMRTSVEEDMPVFRAQYAPV
jgi:hypothetical protein